MTIYELIDKNLPFIIKMMENDLANVNLLKYIEIWERYQIMANDDGTEMPKMDKYEKLGEMYDHHPGTIKRIINKLNRDIK